MDKLLICDAHRNRLLSEGLKNDPIDASKLAQILRANLMREVYHSGEQFLNLRKLVSGYKDLVKSDVRLQKQRCSLLRACGLTGEEKKQS